MLKVIHTGVGWVSLVRLTSKAKTNKKNNWLASFPDYVLCLLFSSFYRHRQRTVDHTHKVLNHPVQTLRLLFFTLFVLVRLLFEGGHYSRVAVTCISSSRPVQMPCQYFFCCLFWCGYYSRAATIQGQHLFLWKAWRHWRWLDKVHTS